MGKISFKNVPKPILVVAVLFVFAIAGSYLLAASHAAGTATLAINPATSNVSLGSNITVTVVENSGTVPTNSMQADLIYDQTKLQYVSADTTAGPFEIVAQNSGGNGTVSLAVATATPQTGQKTVATVTFKAIGLGASGVTFANTSGIAAASDFSPILGTATGATYTVVDSTAPSIPTGLAAPTRTATTIALSWTASTDNVAVTGYRIYRGGTQIGTSATTTYTDSGLAPSNNYSYTVAAVDAAGNVSAQTSALATSTTADTTAPSVPTGLNASPRTLTTIKINWTASTDNVAVTGYKIFRGGTQIGTSTTATYTDTGLTPGTNYSYTITANDAAGNNSSQSSVLATSTLADTTAPSVPTGLTVTSLTTTSVSLSWTGSTDDVAVTGYRIYRGGTQIATATGTTYTNTGLTPGTGYSYTVAAYDAASNVSAQTAATTTTTLTVAGDANGDGHVDYLDLSVLASTWKSTTDLRADFNHDGVINYLDLSALASNWGK